MEQDNRVAEFALHYATVRAFAEDRRCQAKHWARRYFKLGAEARGLTVTSRSMRFPPEKGDRKSCEFVSHYLGFRANSLVLLRKAEALLMELPLKGPCGERLTLHNTSVSNFVAWGGCCSGLLTDGVEETNPPDHVLDEANSDIICTPFLMAKIHLFYGGPEKEVPGSTLPDEDMPSEVVQNLTDACDGIPLTGAQRIHLTHAILQDINIGPELRSRMRRMGPDQFFCSEQESCRYCSGLRERLESEDESEPICLEYLLESNIFADAFAMHDKTRAKSKCCTCGPSCCCCLCLSPLGHAVEPETTVASKPRLDLRLRLRKTWDCCCRFQPISLIRLYFGEKMAFYFAWVGYIIWSLLFITAFGLACLIYGLVYASNNYVASSEKFLNSTGGNANQFSTGSKLSIFMVSLMQFIRLVFENELTIVFGCVLSLWSMTTTETWRKYESSLSYRWDMNNQLFAERSLPNRAVLVRCCCRMSTGRHQTDCLRCLGGFSLIFTCVAIVFAVTVSIQVTKLVATAWHCVGASEESKDSGACFFLATALPALAHIVLIDAFDRLYSVLARKITKWERHRYLTDQENSFAMKEFAFRFANNYAALFYIAFVRLGGIRVGSLTDHCELGGTRVDCFSQLNLLTTYYIVFRSALKSFIDYLWPLVKHCHPFWSALRCFKSLLACFCPCLKSQLYGVELSCLNEQEMRLKEPGARRHGGNADDQQLEEFLEFACQRHMANEGDDVEYLDKMILYGYMVLFGSACFLAPVAALVALTVDLRLDASRLLLRYRRPLPRPSQGLGIWGGILDCLSYAGVFSTAAILAFTSDSLSVFVRLQDLSEDRRVLYRLVLFIAFVSATLSLKFLLIVAIRGPSTKLKMQLKWEYWAVPKILAYERVSEDVVKKLEKIRSANEWFRSSLPCCPGARGSGRKPTVEAMA
ncbi:hypothetical protein BOX15_Mlig028041g2 [Macrostomum lignano]|uniref:Anoctamin n=1 Tax=Macrostomum lignano TaxID=282301 RepID=A0A267EJC1_9PLAT|nr:hypothetical protein BOX15_Mlig028041g2 [Macrostomum lignano]